MQLGEVPHDLKRSVGDHKCDDAIVAGLNAEPRGDEIEQPVTAIVRNNVRGESARGRPRRSVLPDALDWRYVCKAVISDGVDGEFEPTAIESVLDAIRDFAKLVARIC